MTSPVRVRFAPSPTGPLHIGGVRTALYNYLFAKKNNGVFILRIEDTDQTRYVRGAEEYIIESLKWCGLNYSEGVGTGGDFGPYRQSERMDIYAKYAHQLVEAGHAYYAFDTPEELDKVRADLKAQGVHSWQYDAVSRMKMNNSLSLSAEDVANKIKNGTPHVVRIKMPADEQVRFVDKVRGEVVYDSNLLDDKVLLKADGLPTYHLANVVDDHLMKISHVIRGEEWLPSTPLHVLLYRYLGWEDTAPEFAHLPLILKPDGKGKLSKRDGDRLGFPVFPINWNDPATGDVFPGFREMGFLPDGFLNFLSLLGWNPGTEDELFSLEKLSKEFSLERVAKGGAKFDFEKAKWFNQQHLKELDDDVLAELFRPQLEQHGVDFNAAFVSQVCGLLKERTTFVTDLWPMGYFFFKDIEEYDEKMLRKKWKPEKGPLFDDLKSRYASTDNFKAEQLEAVTKQFMAENELGFGTVLPILRIALSGTMKGPGVFEMMEVMGKEKAVSRLADSLSRFANFS